MFCLFWECIEGLVEDLQGKKELKVLNEVCRLDGSENAEGLSFVEILYQKMHEHTNLFYFQENPGKCKK